MQERFERVGRACVLNGIDELAGQGHLEAERSERVEGLRGELDRGGIQRLTILGAVGVSEREAALGVTGDDERACVAGRVVTMASCVRKGGSLVAALALRFDMVFMKMAMVASRAPRKRRRGGARRAGLPDVSVERLSQRSCAE